MSEQNSIELKTLVGFHTLYGVDGVKHSIDGLDRYDESQVVNFDLDGVTYSAIEDPEDGYRSMLDKLIVSNESISNRFPGCKVLGSYDSNSVDDILEFRDVTTGKVVLRIGTENTDDYYPNFIGVFIPENMLINADKLKGIP